MLNLKAFHQVILYPHQAQSIENITSLRPFIISSMVDMFQYPLQKLNCLRLFKTSEGFQEILIKKLEWLKSLDIRHTRLISFTVFEKFHSELSFCTFTDS